MRCRGRTRVAINFLWGIIAYDSDINSPTGLSTSYIIFQHHQCKERFQIRTHWPAPDALPSAPSSANQGAIFSTWSPSLVLTLKLPSLQTYLISSLLTRGNKKLDSITSVRGPAKDLFTNEGSSSRMLLLLTKPETTEATATLASSSRTFVISGERDRDNEIRLVKNMFP